MCALVQFGGGGGKEATTWREREEGRYRVVRKGGVEEYICRNDKPSLTMNAEIYFSRHFFLLKQAMEPRMRQ